MNGAPVTAPLDPAAVQAQLTTAYYGRTLQVVDETGSTNDDASRAAAQNAARGFVLVANRQTAGRGSRGRTWLSPANTDLYLSIVDRPNLPLQQLPPLTLAVGLGVAELVAARLPHTKVEVKWPNDVWVDRQKCAGILVESSTSGTGAGPVVIGIGLNVNRTSFPPDLDQPATSLRLALGEPLDRNGLLADLLNAVERQVLTLCNDGSGAITAALQPRLAMRGHLVQCEGVRGELLGVAHTGALRIQTPSGERLVTSGRLKEEPHG